MQTPKKPPVLSPFNFVFSWRRFLLHCSILSIGALLGILAWFISKPQSIRFYETKSEPLLTTAIASHIDMALDIHSTVAVKNGQPLQVELFKGNVYFDIQKNATDKLEIKVGKAVIKDIGTRFSIRMNKDGSSNIAVAVGQIKIHVASGVYQINAQEQANFDGSSISNHQLVVERDIAPWRISQ